MFLEFLYPLHSDYIFFNVFRYITFRAFGGLLTSLLIYLMLGKLFIAYLRNWQLTQWIREEGPQSHQVKSGTPTMGGILIVASVVISTLLWGNLRNLSLWSVLFLLISYALIGLADDLMKIRSKSNQGLSGRMKLLLQGMVALGVAVWLLQVVEIDTRLAVPFFKSFQPELTFWYIPFAVLVIVGASNAVNLTDGLDGLAAMPSIVAFATYALLAYIAGHIQLANYLQVPYLASAGELTVFCTCIAGAGIGFLWFNTYPAEIFMGDVGSLPLGGTLGLVSLHTKNELLLVIVGGIFVMEAVSVITQVVSFKLTGKRIFRMAPIHHHFELKGWPEPKVIVRFWIISFVLAMIALSTLKLR
jgi:phospho-N-acetylmuramoyl-pentapeptide-transferase